MSAVVEYADAARKYLLRFLNRKRVFYFKASSIDFFKAVILLLQLSIPRIEIIQVTKFPNKHCRNIILVSLHHTA